MSVDDPAAQAELQEEVARLRQELASSREQQAATNNVLRVIAGSPADVQRVLDTLAENAARLCDAQDATIRVLDGNLLRPVAKFGSLIAPPPRAVPLDRGTVMGRSVVDRRTVHVHDLRTEPESEFPQARAKDFGIRSILASPLLSGARPIGTIVIRRLEVRPFTAEQTKLLETFADQAVIAIENTRLFAELQDRNRDLSEALEQQTATSDILRVIAVSPTDLAPVLDAVAESAARLCDTDDALILRADGDALRPVAHFGELRSEHVRLSRDTLAGRAILERRTVQVDDLAAVLDTEYPEARGLQRRQGVRTVLATPLLQEGGALGVIVVRRREVRPFTDQQVKLLETFADQAVIAIENTRVFRALEQRNRDLGEALERQTATGEILRVIAGSPTDLQPVLDAVARNAARLCEAAEVLILRAEGGLQKPVAAYGGWATAAGSDVQGGFPLNRGSVSGRSVIEGRTIHVHDLAAEPEAEYPQGLELQRRLGHRTLLASPLLRQGAAIGTICVFRLEVQPFTEKQIELLKTFADQAVIAIENTRLFGELRSRVGELEALGEIGKLVNSSLDLDRVLDTIVAHAVQLSGTSGGAIYEYDAAGQAFELRATHRLDDATVEALRATPPRLGEGAVGRAAASREPVQIVDVQAEGAYHGRLRDVLLRSGSRALLAVPLLHDEHVVGGLTVLRRTPGEFPEQVVSLLQTFASQSALAIQNARLFRELEAKSAQLEVVSRHKSEFLANMSHELRTPLNAIIGFSEVLVEQMFGELNDKQLEYQRDILTSGQHLLSLINDILDLSKVEAGRMELEPNRFSLRQALENGLTMMKERAGRHGIALGLEVGDGLDEVEADEQKVKQVVFNLLSNAVKFTPDGGRVDVTARLVDGEVEVAVRDSGVGIAPDDLPHVFEEFRQVGRASAKVEGTGLGLPLAKRFVELHGGSIRVESRVGVGSTFTFSLPARAIDVRVGS